MSFLTNREIKNRDKIKVNPIVISRARPESAAAAAKLRVQPPDTQLPTPQAACQTEIDAAVGGGEAAAAVGSLILLARDYAAATAAARSTPPTPTPREYFKTISSYVSDVFHSFFSR